MRQSSARLGYGDAIGPGRIVAVTTKKVRSDVSRPKA